MQFFLLLALLSTSGWSAVQDLEVKLTGLKSTKGYVLYLVFSSEKGFPGDATKSVKSGKIKASEAKQGFLIQDLVPGQYALTITHDENNNGKLDTNIVGMPKEGFGFSKNPKITIGAPDFAKCRFDSGELREISVKLNHFL